MGGFGQNWAGSDARGHSLGTVLFQVAILARLHLKNETKVERARHNGELRASLLNAKAAAQYLGIHEQILKKITARGELQGRRTGLRLVYCLEDLDRYIESLPLSLGR